MEAILPGVQRESLSESYRSSEAVLEAVDKAFHEIDKSELFQKKDNPKPELAEAAGS